MNTDTNKMVGKEKNSRRKYICKIVYIYGSCHVWSHDVISHSSKSPSLVFVSLRVTKHHRLISSEGRSSYFTMLAYPQPSSYPVKTISLPALPLFFQCTTTKDLVSDFIHSKTIPYLKLPFSTFGIF